MCTGDVSVSVNTDFNGGTVCTGEKDRILSIIKRTVPEIIKMLLGLLFIAPLLIGILFSFQSEQELGTYLLHLLSNALICGHLHTDHKDMLSERIPQYVSNESYFGEVTVFRIHG